MQDDYRPTEISTSVDPTGRTALLCIYGEVDLAVAPELTAAALHHIRAGRSLTVDLAHTTFMDAAGVSALVRLSREANRRGGSFTVVNPRHRPVAVVLALTRAGEVVRIEEP